MAWLHENLIANGGAGSPESYGRIVVAKAVFDFITSDSIASVTVNNGGDNYAVGETFDISVPLSPGSVTEVFTAKGIVVSIGTGSPVGSPGSSATRVKIYSGGAYKNLVQSPALNLTNVPTTNASLSGSGMTVDLIAEEAHWYERRGNGATSPVANTDYVNDMTDFEWICTSLKSTNPPTIGLKTTISTGYGAVQLMTATDFDKTQTFYSQTDASPGTIDSIFAPKLLCPGVDPEIYISTSERRVNIMIRDGNYCQIGALGLFIPFTDTEANYPFPGIVAGQTCGYLPFTDVYDDNQATTPSLGNSSVVHPMSLGDASYTQCPYYIRNNTAPTWMPVNKITGQSTLRPISVWPNRAGANDYSETHAPTVSGWSTDPSTYNVGVLADSTGTTNHWFNSENAGTYGIPGIGLVGLNNRMSFVVQPHFVQNLTGDVQVIGLQDGIQAVHGVGLTAFEEIVQHNGKRFIVFPDTNGPLLYNWVAMEIS